MTPGERRILGILRDRTVPREERYRVIAILDKYTCDACRAWSGKIVESVSGLYSIALHCENDNGCRCVAEQL